MLTTFDNINARTGNPDTLAQSDFDAYVDEFVASGSRLASLAQAASATGMTATAKYQHLRASNYMTQALFFVLGTSRPGTEEQLFDLVNQHWQAALATTTPAVVQFSVQAQSYTIPVYFFRPDDSGAPRPTLIISDGSDGQNVETMQFGVVAGLQRGYNVAIFEGPGQMSLLFKEKIPFTPDWDQIVGPILEALAGRPDVRSDRIGLIGLSFAGMLCARAAARTPGLAAVVLEPAAIQMAELWDDQKSIGFVREVQGAPAGIRTKVQGEINAGFIKTWPHLTPEEQFTIHKRSEIFTAQALEDARAGKPPSDYFGVLEAFLPFDYTDDFKAIRSPPSSPPTRETLSSAPSRYRLSRCSTTSLWRTRSSSSSPAPRERSCTISPWRRSSRRRPFSGGSIPTFRTEIQFVAPDMRQVVTDCRSFTRQAAAESQHHTGVAAG